MTHLHGPLQRKRNKQGNKDGWPVSGWPCFGSSTLTICPRGRIMLHEYAKSGDSAMCIALISEGTPVDTLSALGDTALHWAARGGHVAAIEALASQGGDVNRANGQGDTPLHLASFKVFASFFPLLRFLGCCCLVAVAVLFVCIYVYMYVCVCVLVWLQMCSCFVCCWLLAFRNPPKILSMVVNSHIWMRVSCW